MISFMFKFLIDFLEDTVMVSACFALRLASFFLLFSIGSYIYYADIYFSLSILVLGCIFLLLSYFFYIKNINASRDMLLSKLEKKGRKALGIDDSVEAFRLYNKESSCQLPKEPANAKEFLVSILFIDKTHITIYQKCTKSHIYKIVKEKDGKFKQKEVAKCGENLEYYYSYIQAIKFSTGKITITLNSTENVEIPTHKTPGQKAVNKIRKKLREVEKNWKEHSRGSYQHYNIN